MQTSAFTLVLALTACSSPSPAPEPARPAPAPVAITVVFQSDLVWMGEELSPDPYVLENGMLPTGSGYLPLRVAIDAMLAELPPGSEATLIAYGDQPTTLASGPAQTITSAALGTQAERARSIGCDLVGGLEIGTAAITRSKHAHRLLVVIGDGSDFDPVHGLEVLPGFGAELRRARVEAHGFIVDPQGLGHPTVLGVAVPSERLAQPWQLVPRLRDFVRQQVALRQI